MKAHPQFFPRTKFIKSLYCFSIIGDIIITLIKVFMSDSISVSSLSASTSFTIPTFVKIEGLEEKEIEISENIDKPMQSLKQEQARAREIAEKGRKEDWNPGGNKTTGICAAFGCKAVDHIVNHGDQEAIPPLIVTAPTPEMKFLVMNLVRAIYQSLGTGETYQDAKINEKGRALVNKSCQAFISLMTTHTGIKVVGHYPSQRAGIDFSEACPMESVDKFIEDISKTNIGNHHLLFFRSPEQHLTAGHIVYINFEKGVIGDGADGTMWKIPSEFKELFVPVLKAFIKENYGSVFQQVSALALEKSYQPCRIPLCMKKISLYTNLLFNVAKKEGIRPAGAIACEVFTGSDFVQGMK